MLASLSICQNKRKNRRGDNQFNLGCIHGDCHNYKQTSAKIKLWRCGSLIVRKERKGLAAWLFPYLSDNAPSHAGVMYRPKIMKGRLKERERAGTDNFID